ncbi:MAG TPA: hypothetical protein VF808_11230 [Ktedonobacterales bacterium]
MRDKSHRPKRALARALTIILIVSSIVIEWLFLTGAPPSQQALADAFLPAAPEAPVIYTRPSFQTGVIFPRWGSWAYTQADPNYGIGLGEIQSQTGARWVELTIGFRQATYRSTVVTPEASAPTPDSLAEGIRLAHERGFKVFIEPFLSLDTPSPQHSVWGGAAFFPPGSRATALWFEGYWSALEPYMVAGQRAGADQMAIGVELQGLETAPVNYWYWLIAQARSVYSGKLTYNINWTSLYQPVREWMRSPSLAAIGVSVYNSVAGQNEPVPLSSIPERWAATVGAPLDAFAAQLSRPLIISEIGYRNAADALYQPFHSTTTADPDPQLQAALYNAALMYALGDSRIHGIYFWAWSLPPFSPNWLPAAKVMKGWYHSPLA